MLIPGCLNEITEENGGMGTDIMAEKNTPGIICCKHDGWCRNRKRLAGKGRLEDWDHGTDRSVFYYAHLDSYAGLRREIR